jgi:1,4-dihydroxy-2-naphthoate polyprenyltransferase
MKNTKLYIWLQAFRLRTLPLAVSSSILGSFLAYASGEFRWIILLLSGLTTTFLQILSNLANDYGDALSGADSRERIGPERVTQSGKVSRKEMKNMILAFIILSLISGSLLIYAGLSNLHIRNAVLFFLLGFSAVYAAIKYTVGKKPYGYKGLGDLFVFIYFGIVGVAGTFYLHTHTFHFSILLPASAIGLFSAGVLNINNLRDIVSDNESGKHTIVVKLGLYYAKIYHAVLIGLAVVLSVIYTIVYYNSAYQLLFLVTVPLFVLNVMAVFNYKVPIDLNKELKKLALSIFIFSLTFGLGLIL